MGHASLCAAAYLAALARLWAPPTPTNRPAGGGGGGGGGVFFLLLLLLLKSAPPPPPSPAVVVADGDASSLESLKITGEVPARRGREWITSIVYRVLYE